MSYRAVNSTRGEVHSGNSKFEVEIENPGSCYFSIDIRSAKLRNMIGLYSFILFYAKTINFTIKLGENLYKGELNLNLGFLFKTFEGLRYFIQAVVFFF